MSPRALGEINEGEVTHRSHVTNKDRVEPSLSPKNQSSKAALLNNRLTRIQPKKSTPDNLHLAAEAELYNLGSLAGRSPVIALGHSVIHGRAYLFRNLGEH